MAKKKDKNRAGPRVIPAHWQAPQQDAPGATAVLDPDNPAGWPLGPSWATRIDHSGSQGVFLSRRRPWGNSLAVVGAVVNDIKGLTDGMGDHAIGQHRMVESLAEMGHPSRQVYTVPPEYVACRLSQGEQGLQSQGGELAAPYRRMHHLLDGVDATSPVDPAALESAHQQPDLLDKIAVLIHAAEFNDWRAAPDDDEAVKTFIEAVDGILQGLPDEGRRTDGETEPPADLDLLSETETFPIPWPLTDEATTAIDTVIDEHLEKAVSREQADRHRDRLLHMVYLTDLQGQKAYSNLIATAAWSLSPEREGPLTQNALLRALMRKNVVHHLVTSEEIHATHHHH